jgi:hypothetical protein
VFCTDKKLENQIKQILDGKLTNVPEGKKWFEIVALKCQNKPQALFGIPSKLF